MNEGEIEFFGLGDWQEKEGLSLSRCMNGKVLFLFGDGVEELELVAPVDVLRRAGAEVVLAALGSDREVKSRGGLTLQVDALLDEVSVDDFDALVLPGGPGVVAMRNDRRVADIGAEFFRKDQWLAAICAAPLLLKDAGVLAGKRYTSHFSTWSELGDAEREARVVVDGKLVTSRGAGTALEFGLCLVGCFFGDAVREKVAGDIML